MDNNMEMEERLRLSKQLFEGATAQLAVLLPEAMSQVEAKITAKETSNNWFHTFKLALEALRFVLGKGPAESVIYHILRPEVAKPGEKMSLAGKNVLKALGCDEPETEEMEFMCNHPQCRPGAKGKDLLKESIPERVQKEVWKQVTQCASWIDDPKLVIMMNNRTKAFIYPVCLLD